MGWRLTSALALSIAVTTAAVLLLNSSDTWLEQQDGGWGGPSRRLHAAAAKEQGPPIGYVWGRWGVRHIVGLVLSVLVSLLSPLDRECGSSLYMVLFACLLDLPFRQAAALTAFTIALGALGPGIASMCEPRITERGVLAVVDYPGALILLPTMYWGISFGVIVNLVFPNWLLCLLWVLVVLASTIELAISLRRYIGIKRQANQVAVELRELTQQQHGPSPATHTDHGATATSNGGSVEMSYAAAEATVLALTRAVGSDGQMRPPSQPQQAAQTAYDGPSRREREGQLMGRAHELVRQAQQMEALALLYPVLYTPSVEQALRDARLDPAPHQLRLTATPSVLTNMDLQHVQLVAELPQYQTLFGRFTLRWGKWKHLNNHFELALVLKIVVLHLVTEGIRHHTAKPCTGRFWFMLVVMTGAVTGFLIFTVYCYTWRRLWRGPHWVDALAQVRQIMKQQQAAASAIGKDSVVDGQPAAACPSALTAGGAAVAAGDAVAVDVGRQGHHVRPAAAAAGAAGASSADASAVVSDQQGAVQGEGQAAEQQQPAGCAAKLRARLPWFWGPAEEAITNTSDCNSWNQYSSWRLPLMLLCAAATLPIGILGCALGLPGGLALSHMLLALGLKPHVVAATSRFLVLCFSFGAFVAHSITGNLEPTLAAAYGLLNLGLAPLGLLLFTKLKPRGIRVLWMSLILSVSGFVLVTVVQLVPLMANLLGRHVEVANSLAPGAKLTRSTAASIASLGNTFQMSRFCYH